MNLKQMTRVALVAGTTLCCLPGWAEEKPAAAPAAGAKKVSLSVFDAAVQAAAPGIEKVIPLAEEQRKKLEGIYNEVFGSRAVADAQKVLQDEESPRAARQEATETIQAAREWFMKRCASEVFTPAQNELIKKVYAAYNQVRADVLRELAAKVAEGFGKKLDAILTPEQKAALEKGRAEMAASSAQRPQADTPAK